MENNPSSFKSENNPVECVSYDGMIRKNFYKY